MAHHQGLLLTNFCLFFSVGGKLLDPPTGSFVGLFKRSVPFRDGLSIPTLSLPSISVALPAVTFPTYLLISQCGAVVCLQYILVRLGQNLSHQPQAQTPKDGPFFAPLQTGARFDAGRLWFRIREN